MVIKVIKVFYWTPDGMCLTEDVDDTDFVEVKDVREVVNSLNTCLLCDDLKDVLFEELGLD